MISLQNVVKKYETVLYVVFRVMVGLLFAQHGMQKLFGWFGGLGGAGQSAELLTLMGLAGIIELFGGLAIATGFFTRIAALIAAIEMVVAYFMVHNPNGWIPFLNKGELALLYFAAFLILLVHGNGKLSLEQSLLGKETV